MSQENTTVFHKEFVSKLKKVYGNYDAVKNKFESTSNSKIARDLCYSDSQFSRLMNNTASEGEFVRALRNVDRLLNERTLEKASHKKVKNTTNTQNKRLITALSVIILGLLAYFIYQQLYNDLPVNIATQDASRDNTLIWSFENKYIKPYTKLKELPADCDFPCYKYQGKWTLKTEYKIPFFRERNGFHYVAKDATMYARCMDERSEGGISFEGYEYQLHEIWYDKREFPIDSFLMRTNTTKIRDAYNSSDLSKDDNFVKIAYVHTFFRNEFVIDTAFVNRNGKAIGRDIEFLDDDILIDKLGNKKLADELKSEINAIAKNRLEDFSKPISCLPTPVPKKDFHSVQEMDELRFKCQFTTGRFLVDYEKTFVLTDQYINNICR